MRMQPLHQKYLIRREDATKKTESGIVLTKEEKSNRGVVMEVGTGKILPDGTLQALIVQKGATVIFGKYSDQNTIEIEGETLIIMDESDIFGVLED